MLKILTKEQYDECEQPKNLGSSRLDKLSSG